MLFFALFFFQAEDGIRDSSVTGVQTCALPISFVSLLRSGDVRPLLTDLKLVTVVYDGVYPGRSVAVLHDITNNKRYRVKTGEVVGRLRVTQIRPREVVFTVQEFGYERQETLSLAKQEVRP